MLEDIKITQSEADSLTEFIELYLLTAIREDSEIDSLGWVYNILQIYKKCVGNFGVGVKKDSMYSL